MKKAVSTEQLCYAPEAANVVTNNHYFNNPMYIYKSYFTRAETGKEAAGIELRGG